MFIVEVDIVMSRTQCLRPTGTAEPDPTVGFRGMAKPPLVQAWMLAMSWKANNCSFLLLDVYSLRMLT